MGFFDTVKSKAGDLAADAERAGRVTAAQGKVAVLQQDLKKAERELGHKAFALAERGELDHPELALAIERVRAAQGAIDAKESEIGPARYRRCSWRSRVLRLLRRGAREGCPFLRRLRGVADRPGRGDGCTLGRRGGAGRRDHNADSAGVRGGLHDLTHDRRGSLLRHRRSSPGTGADAPIPGRGV